MNVRHRRVLIATAGAGVLVAAVLAYARGEAGPVCLESESVMVSYMIRGAEEAYKAEAERYLDVSKSGTPYPRPVATTKGAFAAPGHPDFERWDALRVITDGPVKCEYTVRAGDAGQPLPAGFAGPAPPPAKPGRGAGSWYVIHAACACWARKDGFWMASWASERWADPPAAGNEK